MYARDTYTNSQAELCLQKLVQRGPTSCPTTSNYEARPDTFLADYLNQVSVKLAKWTI